VELAVGALRPSPVIGVMTTSMSPLAAAGLCCCCWLLVLAAAGESAGGASSAVREKKGAEASVLPLNALESSVCSRFRFAAAVEDMKEARTWGNRQPSLPQREMQEEPALLDAAAWKETGEGAVLKC
jgi:hypothetical protein